MWQIKRKKDVNAFNREDYFQAQIAHTIAQSNSKGKVPFEPFLLKFKTENPKESTKKLTEEEKQAKLKRSVQTWCAYVGKALPDQYK